LKSKTRTCSPPLLPEKTGWPWLGDLRFRTRIVFMHYAILTNPASGPLRGATRRRALATAARILDAEVYGLDLKTREEFALCAREVSSRADVLVVAGGDGTVSDVINAVDTKQTPIAYLPLGSGNALAFGLEYPTGIARAAQRIRSGLIHEYDLGAALLRRP
jgi:diacylglycerol kinase (ATP)